VTRGWLPRRAGSPIPVGGGDAATDPPLEFSGSSVTDSQDSQASISFSVITGRVRFWVGVRVRVSNFSKFYNGNKQWQ